MGRDKFGGCHDNMRRDMMRTRTEHWPGNGREEQGERDTSN